MKSSTAVAIAFALVSVASIHGLESDITSCKDVFTHSTDANKIMEYAENPTCIDYLHELADEGHYVPKENERVILTSLKLHLPRLERKAVELRKQVSDLDQKMKEANSKKRGVASFLSGQCKETLKQRDELKRELELNSVIQEKVNGILKHHERREGLMKAGHNRLASVEIDGVRYSPYTPIPKARRQDSDDEVSDGR